MTEDYCKGCETPERCRWCPNNKSKDRCGFCGREISTEQSVRTGRLWKELADTKKKLDIAVKALKVYSGESGNWWYGYEFQGHYEDYAGEYADKALEQINQKEKQC